MGLSRHQKIKGAIAEIEGVVAILEAELAKHTWHVIDAAGNGLFEGDRYQILVDEEYHIAKYLYEGGFEDRDGHVYYPTHYREIVGPGK